MKKRHHTYQIDKKISQFNLNASHSLRSSRNLYNNPRPSTYSATNKSKNKEVADLSSIWINEEVDAIAIADELSESEQKTFAFRCIETMANLANFDAGQTIAQTLEALVTEKLPAFVTLINEHQAAKNQHQEYQTWSKQFISKVQPLIEEPLGPANEVAQLTEQAVHCVERTMFSKYKMETLASRINCLIESIPNSVEQTGTELQLPQAVMTKLAQHVKQALTSLAR